MTSSDPRTSDDVEALPPAVILVEPQLGENIGAAARAMLNCGLTDLRIVNPRDGWPSEPARANAAGADAVIDAARIFERVEDAVGDLRYLVATTARLRDMVKPVMTPDLAAERLFEAGQGALPSGILFGRERSGLSNDEVALADAAVTFPVNPAFKSLNLAQSVLLMAWEWRRLQTARAGVPRLTMADPSPQAARGDVIRLFDHLEGELDATGFFFPPEKRRHMIRNLRNLLGRAAMSQQDVRTFHGIIRSLASRRHEP